MQSVELSEEQEKIKIFKLHELNVKKIDDEIKRLKDENSNLRLLVKEKQMVDAVREWQMAKVKGAGY